MARTGFGERGSGGVHADVVLVVGDVRVGERPDIDGWHASDVVDVYLTDATDSISGTIRYANDAAAIAGATVEVFDAAGDGSTPVASVVAGADGAYVVSNLPFGTYRVRASADPAVYMPMWYSSSETLGRRAT